MVQLPPRTTSKIEVTDLEKEYPLGGSSVQVLGPLTLEIEEGEFVCVLGPSGCGKSTLLRIAAGLTEPSAGLITLRPRRGARSPLAMVFQDYAVYPWKTVRQNVRLGLEVSGTGRRRANEITDDWLERLGLTAFADSYPDTLSGGMRQRVGIARALAVEPEVLLMDEPFAALDPQLRAKLQAELLGLWQDDHRTVVFVTHSLDEAIVLGDRIVVMSARPGQILADLPVEIERPRVAEDVRSHPKFNMLYETIWDLLKLELA